MSFFFSFFFLQPHFNLNSKAAKWKILVKPNYQKKKEWCVLIFFFCFSWGIFFLIILSRLGPGWNSLTSHIWHKTSSFLLKLLVSWKYKPKLLFFFFFFLPTKLSFTFRLYLKLMVRKLKTILNLIFMLDKIYLKVFWGRTFNDKNYDFFLWNTWN